MQSSSQHYFAPFNHSRYFSVLSPQVLTQLTCESIICYFHECKTQAVVKQSPSFRDNIGFLGLSSEWDPTFHISFLFTLLDLKKWSTFNKESLKKGDMLGLKFQSEMRFLPWTNKLWETREIRMERTQQRPPAECHFAFTHLRVRS